jgi:hypothetical protein
LSAKELDFLPQKKAAERELSLDCMLVEERVTLLDYMLVDEMAILSD